MKETIESNATMVRDIPSDTREFTRNQVVCASGDGIGPEIMEAVLKIMQAAGAEIDFKTINMGLSEFEKGNTSGIDPNTWDLIRNARVILKAPVTTPQGGGFKSINVTLRKMLGLYANIRPCVSYHPFVSTKNPGMDVVIIRENEEDLYAGIEHQQTDEVVQCLKLITRPGCEKIVRYAFEYARANARKKVTCFTKDNIMKQTDGLFHKVFDEIGAEYPEIQKEHYIIDIGAAKLATTPEIFDVIVTLNLYGDIISDIAAEVAGSVGLAGSANIGDQYAMFEAIHGSAPDIAGKNIANPSGLLNAAVDMLVFLGQSEVAKKIKNAWLKTLEDGIHTADIAHGETTKLKVGTKEFADHVIERLGEKPSIFKEAQFAEDSIIKMQPVTERRPAMKKELVGVDVFIHWPGHNPNLLAFHANKAVGWGSLRLKMITNRGLKVWPEGFSESFCSDHWRLRFTNKEENDATINPGIIARLLEEITKAGLEFIKTENLYRFDGKAAYSLGQGQ